jgi:hypothetical protein
VVEAKDRAAMDAFTRSDPYHVHGVWARIDVHYSQEEIAPRPARAAPRSAASRTSDDMNRGTIPVNAPRAAE